MIVVLRNNICRDQNRYAISSLSPLSRSANAKTLRNLLPQPSFTLSYMFYLEARVYGLFLHFLRQTVDFPLISLFEDVGLPLGEHLVTEELAVDGT
jgi:hypothetical protein